MKNIIRLVYVYAILYSFFSCTNENIEQTNANNMLFIDSNDYIWKTIHQDGNEYLVKGKKIELIEESIPDLIFYFNLNILENDYYQFKTNIEDFDIPVLQFESITGDTLNIILINGHYISQRMGTAGATDYLAQATYTLTENTSIEKVHYKFTEGDHATPGLYSRQSFQYYRIFDSENTN